MTANRYRARLDIPKPANDDAPDGGLAGYVGEREAIRLFRQQGLSLREATELWRTIVRAEREARRDRRR